MRKLLQRLRKNRENSNNLDYVIKLKPKINRYSRIIIFIVLLLSVPLFIFASLMTIKITWWSDLSINLAAGSMGSLVTVFIIDYLINKEKTSKLIAINKLNHHGLLSYIRILMIRIMEDFGYVSKKDRFDYINNSEKKFSVFINDKHVLNELNDLNQLSKANLKFIKKINKTLRKGWEYLAKNLKQFKPYPDPSLVHKVSIEMSYNAGVVSVGEDVLGFYFDKLPKKVSKKEIDKMIPGMTVLWKIVAEGLETPSRSYKNYYLNSLRFLIELSNRCKNEDVHFNI